MGVCKPHSFNRTPKGLRAAFFLCPVSPEKLSVERACAHLCGDDHNSLLGQGRRPGWTLSVRASSYACRDPTPTKLFRNPILSIFCSSNSFVVMVSHSLPRSQSRRTFPNSRYTAGEYRLFSGRPRTSSVSTHRSVFESNLSTHVQIHYRPGQFS